MFIKQILRESKLQVWYILHHRRDASNSSHISSAKFLKNFTIFMTSGSFVTE
jgi:hypothetical protein